MAKGLAREARRTILTHLKADTSITDLVAATSIYSQTTPTTKVWPFIKMGAFSSVPLRVRGCVDGAEIRATVHAFAKSTFNGAGGKTADAEDNIDALAKAIEASLDYQRKAITGGNITFSWLNTIPLIDNGEDDAFHAVIDFRGRILAA